MTDGDFSPECGEPKLLETPQASEGRDQWSSAELLGERTEVLILHGNETYRLRRTRQDKLILYK